MNHPRRSQKSRLGWPLAVLVVGLATTVATLADGKVFSQATLASPVTPDQRALIHFTNGTQTLVVATSFAGEGTNFAWVVPLPAKPEITAVSPSMFQNLEMLFRPEIVRKQPPYWIGLLALTLPVAYLARGWQQSRFDGCMKCVLVLLLVFVFAIFTIPNFVRARSSLGASVEIPGVSVLERKLVGVFEITTIESTEGNALMRWLSENGFAMPAAAEPVIADYARTGWVFVAARIHREAGAGTKSNPHPLAFTFKTDRAVYPLRLTGVENDSCLVDLHVFGPERAEVPGFKVGHCHLAEYPEVNPASRDYSDGKFSPPKAGEIRVRHPDLRRIVDGAAVATKLTARLTAGGMAKDAYLVWSPFRRKLPVVYSRGAAWTCSLNWAVPGLLAALVLQAGWLRWKRHAPWRFKDLLAPHLAGFMIGAVAFLSIATANIVVKSGWQYHPRQRERVVDRLSRVIGLVDERLQQNDPPGRKIATIAELLVAIGPPSRPGFEDVRENIFTGEPIREEASAGNLILHATEKNREIIWFDIDSVGYVIGVLPR